MHRSAIIQKFLAFFVLVVFAISAVPKHLFHDVLTTHADQPVCQDIDKTLPHFHRPVFHCSFDDATVTTPFLPIQQHLGEDRLPVAVTFAQSFVSFYYSAPLLHAEGRGPPAA